MRLSGREETTFAGNPGGIRIKPLHYARFYPLPMRRFAGGVALLTLGIALSILTKGVSLLLLLVGLRLTLDGQRRLRNLARHFRLGNALAGIVVDTQPFTVAALTDLSTGEHAVYHALKIVPFPGLAKVRGRSFSTGDRVPCVAQYMGRMPTPKWDNFNPLPAVFATDDADELERVEASIPEAYWIEVNEALFQVPKPYRNGLFQVTLPTD